MPNAFTLASITSALLFIHMPLQLRCQPLPDYRSNNQDVHPLPLGQKRSFEPTLVIVLSKNERLSEKVLELLDRKGPADTVRPWLSSFPDALRRWSSMTDDELAEELESLGKSDDRTVALWAGYASLWLDRSVRSESIKERFVFSPYFQSEQVAVPKEYKSAVVQHHKLLGEKYEAENYDWPLAQGARYIPIQHDGRLSFREAVGIVKCADRHLDKMIDWKELEMAYTRVQLKPNSYARGEIDGKPTDEAVVEYEFGGYECSVAIEDQWLKVGGRECLRTRYHAILGDFFWHMSGEDLYVPVVSGSDLVGIVMITTLTYDIKGFLGEHPEATIRENAGNICAAGERGLKR